MPNPLLTYKIFLASSAELADDRIAFGDMIGALNDSLLEQNKKVHFLLYKWERDVAAFSDQRKQDEYNNNIVDCHIFVILYGTKVGPFTEEEYDYSYKRFQETGVPQILVFKKAVAATDKSVTNFEEKLRTRDGQFKSRFTDVASLKVQFTDELQKYFAKGILKCGVPAETLYNDGQTVPTNFMGRVEELKTIREKLDEGGKLMLINAEGGIGKTTLAAKYWQESVYDYQHNAWLFCENGIVNELKKLASGLNLDLTNLNGEEQIAALKNALQNISRHFLLVLDNANKEDEIKVFKQTFQGFNWHVLITSRCKGVLEKENEYLIAHLPPPVAKDLFISNYKEDTPEFDTLLNQFLAAIHYHTLLVDIFSKNMVKLRKRKITFTDFLAQLEGGGLFLEKGSFEVVTVYTDSRHKMAATTNDILNILYDFSELSEAERYWLVNMALLPAVSQDFVFLCDLFKQDKMEFLTLDELAGKGWLMSDDTSYRISPVIQGITLKKNKNKLHEDAKALIDNLNKKLENNGTYLKHFNEADPYATLTESITKHLINQPFRDLILLNFNACTYYISTGDLVTAKTYAENGKAISEKLEDKNGLSISYSKLGGINEKLGRLPEASKFYEERNRIGKELYRDYPTNMSFKNGLAISYSKLGNINQKLGRLPKALKFYEDYKRLMEELLRDYPTNMSFKNGLAVSYENLGDINKMLGKVPEALQFYENCNKLVEDLHQDYPADVSFKNNLAISYLMLGDINIELGKLPKALQFYKERKRISEELNWDYPADVSFRSGLATSYSRLGRIKEELDRLPEALKFYEDYKRLMEELHRDYPADVSYKNGLAISCQKLGDVNEKLGKLPEALQFYEGYKRLKEELHREYPADVSYKNGLAISYTKIAGVVLQQGNQQKAIALFKQAEDIWKELVNQFHGYTEFIKRLEWVQQELDVLKTNYPILP